MTMGVVSPPVRWERAWDCSACGTSNLSVLKWSEMVVWRGRDPGRGIGHKSRRRVLWEESHHR